MAAKRRAGEMTTLKSLWRKSWAGLFAIASFSLVINILKFAMPLYLIQVLDRVPASRSVETLVMLTIMVVIAVASGYALDIVRRKMLIRWGVWLGSQLGPRIVQRGLSGSVGGPDTREVEAALADVSRLRSFVSGYFVYWLDLIWSPLFVLGVFLIHPYLGLLAMASIALLLVFGILQDQLTREQRSVSSTAYREASEVIQSAGRHRESVTGLSLGRNLTTRWFNTEAGRLSERNKIEGRIQVFRLLMRGVADAQRIAMIGFGVWLVLMGQLTLGGIFAARIMAGFSFNLVEGAVRNWRRLTRTLRSYRDLSRFLGKEASTDVTLPDNLEDADLVVDNVSFKHPSQIAYMFRRLSFTLKPGEMLLISGQAAMGKTTLSRLLVGLLEPREGVVRLGEIEVSKIPDDLRARLFGYVPQNTELFNGSIFDNIGRFGQGSFSDVVAAAKLVGLHEFILQLHGGYDASVQLDAFTRFSGSQRKRIAIARALLGRPRLIILDEPTANLDAPSRRVLEAALADLKQSGSTVVVTQSVHSAQLSAMADKHLILGGSSKGVDLVDGAGKTDSAKVKSMLKSVK
ncbi:type I secretion system permease/ATPase [Ruegeria arenilitoris]|uniref:type I secretion system permease/ATPase n=1 Tax=Ruegeria arenilitoris TaxID=1173585 RepID=UPI00147A224B|nr:ATP-binding cassette domain-containing protein [Ruegeria arenilitoris]